MTREFSQFLPYSELTATTCAHPPRSVEFRDFLKTALDKNPETRPSAAQLLEVRGCPVLGVAACPLCPALLLHTEDGQAHP